MNILVVCKANYCRSPVGHKILQENCKNIRVDSAGIIEFFAPSMHKESIQYLINKKIKDIFHNPKMITTKMIKEAKYIFVMDYEIYDFFLKNHHKYLGKVKMYNFLDHSKMTSDPISFNSEDYIKIMENINYLSLKIADWINDEHQ